MSPRSPPRTIPSVLGRCSDVLGEGGFAKVCRGLSYAPALPALGLGSKDVRVSDPNLNVSSGRAQEKLTGVDRAVPARFFLQRICNTAEESFWGAR